MNNKAYIEESIENGVVKRTFSKDVNSNELEWHRDKEDRVVKAINENDWMIQFDNELPREINVNEEIKIPKETFHRVIKGSTDLVIKINENLQISEKSPIFVKNNTMKEIIKDKLHETSQQTPVREKPKVVPEEKPILPRRRRIWETKPVVKPKPKMDETNDFE